MINHKASSMMIDKVLFNQNPLKQFQQWFKTALKSKVPNANAMVLATVSEDGTPDARVVLLKEFDGQGFVFYTNYNSPKAKQAEALGKVVLNFYWPQLDKQIRIKGTIDKISRHLSCDYFSSRPRASQINAWASSQSSVIKSREELLQAVKKVTLAFKGQKIPCPKHWGGYRVKPYEFEFFESKKFRLNERIRYCKVGRRWVIEILSP